MRIGKDRLGGILLLVFFAAYAVLTLDIELADAQQDAFFTARTLPHALAALGLGGAAWLIAFPPGKTPPAWSGLRWSRLLAFLALMSAYGFSIRPLGFLLATVVFLMCGFVLLGERRPILLAGVAVVVATGFWTLLSVVLGVYLAPWPALGNG